MDWLAELLWNPFLSLWYIAVGVLFVFVTGAVAWRRSGPVFRKTWKSSQKSKGERGLSHRQAFFAALAAGIGVGNLAGVATALHLGGPGALFWMWISALIGMSFRMSSTYLSIRHRPKSQKSVLFATPMTYLEKFLPGRLKIIPPILAGLLLVKGMVAANMIQANSVAQGLSNGLGIPSVVVAVVLALAVVLVIVGGVKSIVRSSVIIAPWMLLIYIAAGVLILLKNPLDALGSLLSVFQHAFHPYSVFGGVAGYSVFQALQFGISRGVFSHGSGIGIAPFLQGSNTDHPSRGAYMAAVVPLFDTLLVCTITGLVILTKGSWQDLTSAHLTVSSFEAGLGTAGKFIVSFCLVTFAFTTIISWAYFSERCFQYLGGRNVLAFRWFFAGVTFIGPFFPVALVWSFGDVLIGLLLMIHLLSLIYVVLKTHSKMMADLGSPVRARQASP